MAANIAFNRLQVLLRCIRRANYSTCATKPAIHLSKPAVLMDEKVQIVINNLPKHQKVTLHSSLKDSNKFFAACGHYVADEKGEVNTFQHPSLGGTFDGVEDMGLFWSMKSQHSDKPKRIMKADVMTPFDVKIAVHDGFLNFDDLPGSEDFPCLNYCTLKRHYAVSGVRRIPVRENGIYGVLFLPPGEGPFPTVIDLFGMAAGYLELRSPLLASHGIASFSLGYVGIEDLPKNEFGLDFNYFLKGFDWLTAHPSVDENAMGGISTCVGGGYVALLAMKRPSMKAFVSINNNYAPVGPDQTIEGEDIHSYSFKYERMSKSPEGIRFRSLYRKDDEISINPIWRHGVKVLQIHGLDDQCVHPDIGRRVEEIIPDEFKNNFTRIEYPGAGHLLEPPYGPLCGSSYNDIFKQYMLWGGEPKLHAHASEDCWRKVLSFFNTYLQSDARSYVIHQNVAY